MPARSQSPEAVPRTSSQLRREISARNLALAADHAHETTYGQVASVVYREDKDGQHGNFFPASYQRICARPAWARRLQKVYTASHRIARGEERTRAELDCATSSDALLMNIFCHPRSMQSTQLRALLNVSHGQPEFGVRVRTPLRNNLDDRTEVDMRIDDLLVEAKLSETGFQSARPDLMSRYERFEAVFNVARLPATRGSFTGYQLLRGILAAEHHGARFAVFCDARRPDLREQWFSVLAAVHHAELRSRILFVTWQEIAACVPPSLQKFLATKYGIEATR